MTEQLILESTDTLANTMYAIRLLMITDPAGSGRDLANQKITSSDDEILREAVREFLDTRLPHDDARARWGNKEIAACVHAAHASVVTMQTQKAFTLTNDFSVVSDETVAHWRQEMHCAYMSLRIYYCLLWYVLFIDFPAYLILERNNPMGIRDEMGMKWLSEKLNAFAAADLPFFEQTTALARWHANVQ